VKVDGRSGFRLVGVAVGAIAAVWAAVQGDYAFAAVLGVASVLLGLGVLHLLRQSQR
jgi:hypothetical protein